MLVAGCGSSSNGSTAPTDPAALGDGGTTPPGTTTAKSCSVGTADVVASGQKGASEIVADEEFVYWTTRIDGKLWRAPVAGSGVTPELLGENAGGFALALDAKNVYAVVSSVLTAIDKTTLTKSAIGGVSNLRGIAVRGDSLFFESSGVYKWNGTKAEKIRPSTGSSSGFRNLAVDDAFVFDLATTPAKLPLAGGEAVPLAGVISGFAAAVDAQYMYIARQKGLDIMTKDGVAVGSAPLATVDVVTDADSYFVLTSNGPFRGQSGSPTPLPLALSTASAGVDATTGIVNGIAVNTTHVFYTAAKDSQAANEVYRVEKCASGS